MHTPEGYTGPLGLCLIHRPYGSDTGLVPVSQESLILFQIHKGHSYAVPLLLSSRLTVRVQCLAQTTIGELTLTRNSTHGIQYSGCYPTLSDRQRVLNCHIYSLAYNHAFPSLLSQPYNQVLPLCTSITITRPSIYSLQGYTCPLIPIQQTFSRGWQLASVGPRCNVHQQVYVTGTGQGHQSYLRLFVVPSRLGVPSETTFEVPFETPQFMSRE